jgi:diacylglycerol kinase family enzyme
MTYKILVNPCSGSGEGKKLLTDYAQHFLMQETSKADITTQIKEFVGMGDTLVVAGGDGTVNLVISALVALNLLEKITVTLYPIGTGNDLARAMKIPSLPFEAFMEKLAKSTVQRKLGVFRFNGRLFTHYLSFGMDAKCLHEVDAWRKKIPTHRWLNLCLYAFSGIKNFFGRSHEIRMHMNNEVIHQKALCVIFSGISSYGGGCFLETPSSSHLNSVVINGRLQWIKLMLTRFTKRPYPVTPVTLPVSIESASPFAQMDGEITNDSQGQITLAGVIHFQGL